MAQLIVSWLICDDRLRVHAINAVGQRRGRIIEIEHVATGGRFHGSAQRLERMLQRIDGESDQDGRGRQTGLLNVNVCLGGRCEGRCMHSFFLKVAKTFYGFLPILFRHLDDLVGRRTRSAETIQASMRCPFHGFQPVQFFIRREHRFDLPDRPLKHNEQAWAAVAEHQWARLYDPSDAAPTMEQLPTHCGAGTLGAAIYWPGNHGQSKPKI